MQRRRHRGRPLGRGRSRPTRPRPERQPQSTPLSANGGAPQPRRRTVLVIEDNASVGGILVGLLRETGYRALRAWDSREAVKMARDRRPDLMIFDLGLAYPDTFGPLTELRSHGDLRKTPIIIASTQPLPLSVEEQETVAAVLTKPVQLDRFMNHVRRALGEPEVELPETAYTAGDDYLHSW